MNVEIIARHVSTGQEALRSFLATLLGEEAPLHVEAPEPYSFEQFAGQASPHVILTAGASPAGRFAVLLDPGWLPLLSKSMLGEAIQMGEPGADDLLRELAAQAYGALRTQLAATGVTLSEAQFELVADKRKLTQESFHATLAATEFKMTFEESTLGGLVVMPAPQEGQAAAPPRAGSPAKPERAAPAPEAPRSPSAQPQVNVAAAQFPDLGDEMISGDGANGSFSLLAEVELEVTVELGRRKIPLADVLRLTTGSVIELDKLVGEPLAVYANGRLIAEGEAVVIDEQFGIRVTRLISNRQRARSFM